MFRRAWISCVVAIFLSCAFRVSHSFNTYIPALINIYRLQNMAQSSGQSGASSSTSSSSSSHASKSSKAAASAAPHVSVVSYAKTYETFLPVFLKHNTTAFGTVFVSLPFDPRRASRCMLLLCFIHRPSLSSLVLIIPTYFHRYSLLRLTLSSSCPCILTPPPCQPIPAAGRRRRGGGSWRRRR